MNLKEYYTTKIVPELMKEFNIKNKFSVPIVKKIVLNVGVGKISQKPSFKDKLLPNIIKEVSLITGQKPAYSTAKKSIAGFKVRAGNIVGIKATLIGQRMYDFIERVVKLVFPRLRDFKGIDLKNIDESGNLNLGFKDHLVFPEIDLDKSDVDFGLQVTIVVNSKNREQAIELYKKLGFLFKKVNNK